MILVPSKMGQWNKRALLARLQLLGRASRAELAKSLGLSQPTAGKIVDEMLAIGLLEEFDDDDRRQTATLGRPGRMLGFDNRQARLVTIQLGVTETSVSAAPGGGRLGRMYLANSIHYSSFARAVAEGMGEGGGTHRGQRALGSGGIERARGVVDEKNGTTVLFSPNLHWTEGAVLPGLIGQIWKAPVALVQEERALALGHQAAAPTQEDFLLVDFGEGVGGAAMIGGKPFVPPLPISGELGHTPVLGNKRPCGCGGVGCLETLVSTSGLLRSFASFRPNADASWPSFVRFIAGQGIVPWLAETLESAAGIASPGRSMFGGCGGSFVTGCLEELRIRRSFSVFGGGHRAREPVGAIGDGWKWRARHDGGRRVWWQQGLNDWFCQ